MRKGRIAAGFIGISLPLSAAGAALAGWSLGGKAGGSAAAGVAAGWAVMMGGFVVLVMNLDRSANRFFGAYAVGLLLRMGVLGAATVVAVVGWGDPEPLLLGMAFTVVSCLLLEGVVLWIGTGGKLECQ
jgi:hypothetical protein